MTKYKIKYTVFILLFFVGCQPAVRFASNIPDVQKKTPTIKEKLELKPAENTKKENKNISDKKSDTSFLYIITIAESWLGVSYKYGGNDKNGVDCSGLVKNIFKELGINLPRTSGEQFLMAIPIKTPEVGDLVFFKKNNRIYHVGICVGSNIMIHASSSSGVIRQNFTEGIYAKNYAGAGRIKM